MLNDVVLNRVLEAAVSQGGDFAEVFCEHSSNTQLLIKKDEVETSSHGIVSGVGIRVFDGLGYRYGYTTDWSETALIRLAKELSASCKGNGSARANGAAGLPGANGTSGGADLAGRPGQVAALETKRQYGPKVEQYFDKISYRDKKEAASRAIRAAMAYDPEICQSSVKYLDMDQKVLIANTEGLHVEDRRVKTRMLISAYAQNESGIQNGYWGPGAMQGFEYYNDLDIEWYGRESARIAKTMLHAKPCPGGRMTVVVNNGFGGLMFHEACGHSLESSSVAKGTSEFSGRLGEQVASPLVTLVDDGSVDGQWGSLGVDDEGTPVQKNILIENGILKGYMIDRLGGMRMGMKPTGSARRQDYRFAPTARMTNTYIANGESRPQKILANTERGLFVKYINGGSVNPATGDFNFNTCECWLIENGKLTVPVRGATLIGNGSDILRQVDMVGNDGLLGQGYCFAFSGALFISAGQPTVRVANMTVGGVANA